MMIVKIARQSAIDKYPNLPLRKWNEKTEEIDESFVPTFSSYVLTLPSKSYRGKIKLLGIELSALAKNLGFDKLIFLGDFDIPWLKREHDFAPAKKALQYLTDNKLGKRFNGALQVDTTELPTFIIHLAWLVRTNAVLPYVYFIDPGQHVIGTICQYGNMHFCTLNEAADKIFNEEILKTEFRFLNSSESCKLFA